MNQTVLQHHGVLGMKWGIRKDRNSSRQFKSGNLNLFGTEGHNAVFVTGLSGSGKSTFSLELSKKLGAEVIHLDSYFEKAGKGNNKNFNRFLENNGVTKQDMFKNGKLDYSVSDKILPLIKKYNKKVVVEGVQILDTTLSDTARSFLKEEPVISLQTSKRLSTTRAMNRDGISETKINDMIQRAEEAFKIKSEMEKELNLAIGSYYVDQLLKGGT